MRDEGIYTCVIPDENGDLQYLYAGLYLRGFNCNQIMVLHIVNIHVIPLPFSITSNKLTPAYNGQ